MSNQRVEQNRGNGVKGGQFGFARDQADPTTADDRASALDADDDSYDSFVERLTTPVEDRTPVADTVEVDLSQMHAPVEYVQTDADREWWEPHLDEAEQIVAELEAEHPRLSPRPSIDDFPGTPSHVELHNLESGARRAKDMLNAAKRQKLSELIAETPFDPPLNEYTARGVVDSLRPGRTGQFMGGAMGGPAIPVPKRKLSRSETEILKSQQAQLDVMWTDRGRTAVTEATTGHVQAARDAAEAHERATAANAAYKAACDAHNRSPIARLELIERHRSAKTIVGLANNAPAGGQFHEYPEQAGLQRRADGGWNAWLSNGERVVNVARAGADRGQGAGVGLIGERGGENVGVTHWANHKSTRGTGDPIYVPPCDTDGPHFKMPFRNVTLDSGD